MNQSMPRLDDLPEAARKQLAGLACPSFDGRPWATGPELGDRRIALISTAGLHRRGDRNFLPREATYRIIPGEIAARDLIMSHVSTNFDRTGFEQDWNVVFPIDRLRELADQGEIGSVAANHYSFMGATPPEQMEEMARRLADLLHADRVTGALLVPV